MKVTKSALCVVGLMASKKDDIGASAKDTSASILASWVQYTGADMDICKQNAGAASQTRAPFCHFTAEVRAIVDDPDMIMEECPSGILQVDGQDVAMDVRVNATEAFPNIVSRLDC